MTSMDMLFISSGVYQPLTSSEDQTCRLWKIQEETQLVYKDHHKVSIDCIALGGLKHTFVSGSQDGGIALWNIAKKRPIKTVANAHQGWVSCCSACPQSDLLATASSDGIKLWKSSGELKQVGHVQVKAFVNDICFAPKAKLMICAEGQEHKFGRWTRVKGAKNRVSIYKL